MDPHFQARSERAKVAINQLDKDVIENNPERTAFFETVYENAAGDAAGVPWADLAVKDRLQSWLAENLHLTGRAMDIGCGLGDNAEALANFGHATTAFDFSPRAIDWANKRFAGSAVDYHVADLFDLPADWLGAFDLVHECYTLQSIPPSTLEKSVPAVASLVSPGGRLLVYSRIREDGSDVDGPPWPLEEQTVMSFDRHGLKLVSRESFSLQRPDKEIPHVFCVWRRPG